MRTYLLLLSLCISFNSFSQDRAEIAFRANIPTDLGKEIRLPEPGSGSFNLEQFQSTPGSKNVMVIATDSFYRKIFSLYSYTKDSLANFTGDKTDWWYKRMVEYQRDSIPAIDFSRYDLVMFSACGYCMALCQHDKGIQSCHRAACQYEKAWFIREKTLGRVGEQVIMR